MTKLKKILKNAFTGLILKKPAKKVFNKVSGRDKIKKIAEQQKEQKTFEINNSKQQACSAVQQHYQQCLAEIAANKRELIDMQNILAVDKQEIINYICQAKNNVLHQDPQALQERFNHIVNVLDHHATEIEAQYVMAIREVEAEIIAVSQHQAEVEVRQAVTEQEIRIISQRLSEQLDFLASTLENKYDELLNNNNGELASLENQESLLKSECSKELAIIHKQYNDALEVVVQQIDSWRTQASKKATKSFVIQTASGILANCIAPGISATFQVGSKVGMAAIKAATFSTINNIATGQIKTLPKTMLKNVATNIVNPLVSVNIVDPLNIANASLREGISGGISNGILAKRANQNVLAGIAQGGVRAYVEQLLEDIITSPEAAVDVQHLQQAEAATTLSTQEVLGKNTSSIDPKIKEQPEAKIEVKQAASLGLFEFDREPLPAPTREELFPTKPPKSSFSKAIQKNEVGSSLKIMERNDKFQPVSSHQGKIFDFVEQKARDQSLLPSTVETRQDYALDVVRKNYGPNTSIGITPFFSVKTSNSAYLPGVTKAATETKVEAGINLLQTNSNRFKLAVDLGRIDVLAGAEMTVGASLNGPIVPKNSSYLSVQASAIAATAEIGPVRVPFSDIACTSSVKAGLLNYNSNSVLQTSISSLSVSTTCGYVVSEEQALNSSSPSVITSSKASLRP